MKNKIGYIIRDLRLSKGLTQKQLADLTGLSLSAIKSYENSHREPNSKAMVALENFFSVSGDFLRGNLDRDTFMSNSEKIQNELDLLIEQFLSFKNAFAIASQEKQRMVLPFVEQSLKSATTDMLLGSSLDSISVDDFSQLLSIFSCLNADGKSELLKRCSELLMLPQYSTKK